MLEDNPMLCINVKLWKRFSLILNRSRSVYIIVALYFVLNAMQFVYLFRMWGDLAPFILNTFYAAAVLNSLLRFCFVLMKREQFEAFMYQLDGLYREIQYSDDDYAKGLLLNTTRTARIISICNLMASFSDITGALFCPLFSEEKTHPFGVAIPGVDMTIFPVYEIFYLLQIPGPILLSVMYMPFVSLFATFAMFGKTALQILQYKLTYLCHDVNKSDAARFEDLRSCIAYYNRFVCYFQDFNSLVTYIVGLEFLIFSAIICSLLFCINILDSFTQIIAAIMYILTMLYVLFTYYYLANEVLLESSKVGDAAYNMLWFDCDQKFKKTLLLFIIRCQMPLKIMVGNVYPMTLELFQSLLNASYSYFTLLRNVNEK